VILASAMSKDGVPSSLVKFELTKAAEFMKMKVGSAGLFKTEDIAQEAITRALYQMRNKDMLWLHEFELDGMRDGEPLNWGLARRGMDNLRYNADFVKASKGNLRQPREPILIFLTTRSRRHRSQDLQTRHIPSASR